MSLLLKIPTLAQELTNGLVPKLLLMVRLLFFLTLRAIKIPEIDYMLRIEYGGQRIPITITNSAHLAGLIEIYIENEYKWFPLNYPTYIIDLGAHIGDTALYYHALFPRAKIIAVEPLPQNFRLLKKNTQNIESIIPVQAAVSDVDGIIDLYETKSSLGASTKERSNFVAKQKVEAITLKTLFDRFEISKADIIKFDIEGGEDTMIPANDSPEMYARAYIGEVHGDLMSTSVDTLVRRFKNFTVVTEPLSNTDRFIIKAFLQGDM